MIATSLFWGLLAHFVGDYLIQSDWMAAKKTSAWTPAWAHALSYAVCFVPVLLAYGDDGWRAVTAFWVIAITHLLIDRFRLARYLAWAKNQAAPRVWRHPWDGHVSGTGYHRPMTGPGPRDPAEWIREECATQAKPDFMAVWLMIIADNTIHIAINSAMLVLAVGGR